MKLPPIANGQIDTIDARVLIEDGGCRIVLRGVLFRSVHDQFIAWDNSFQSGLSGLICTNSPSIHAFGDNLTEVSGKIVNK